MHLSLPRPWTSAAAALATSLCLINAFAAPPSLKLHVPSPDWRDQVLYFVVTDRFDDGDPRNNDQGAGEFDPRRPNRYSGGDFAGLQRRLDYIQGLGATGVWITPPVANQWLNAQGTYAGYHGYWAEHFMRVDPHLGTLRDYQRLSDALHRRGMVLIQDIVVNHVGDFFHYVPSEWRSGQPAVGWRANMGSRPVVRPRQAPFDRNDPRRPADRAAGIYHWTPDVVDYQDPVQEQTFQMSGLDDLNTGNPAVQEALRRSYAYWIRTVGVDGFRVDTAFYVPPAFFEDFLWRRATPPSRTPSGTGDALKTTGRSLKNHSTPGMAEVARATGRNHFWVFGEGFGIDAPGSETQSRKIASYLQGPEGQPRMNGMLDFPLYGALGDVLGRGAPTSVLGDRLRRQAALWPQGAVMATFLDNHDVDRFRAGADRRALEQGLGLLFTLPGVPVVYYGTEQEFTEQRASMFAAGWGSGGQDHFRLDHPLARTLRSLADLRKAQAPLRRGTLQVLTETSDDAGALVFRRSLGDQHAVVALNTADLPVALDAVPVGVPSTAVRGQWSVDGTVPAVPQGSATGRWSLVLPPRSLQVWTLDGRLTAEEAGPQVLQLQAQQAPWTWVADQEDPAGDDVGLDGQVRYPTDPVYSQLRPGDLRRIRVATRPEGEGHGLQVCATLAGLSTVWNPRNGFDHVAFTLFVQLPGQEGGSSVMPLQQGSVPGGFHWHRRLRAHGWSLALFDAAGASAQKEGTPIARGTSLTASAERKEVCLRMSSAALGHPASLQGARVWLNTWDWDGSYRGVAPEPEAYRFGGASPDSPLVLDASSVVTLP